MNTLHALYLEHPFWIWLGVASLLVGFSLATGLSAPLAPAFGTLLVGLLDLAGLRMSPGLEAVVALTATGVAAAAWLAAISRESTEEPPAPPSAELVGRIGRTAGEFVNGVGRVRLDGAEWSAELTQGEDAVAPGVPVRVTAVIGGVKLKVQAVEG